MPDQALFKVRVGLGVDVIDATVLVVWDPDKELALESGITFQLVADTCEIDLNILKQEFAVGVAFADRLLIDHQALDEGLDIVRVYLVAEDDMEVQPLPAGALLVEQHIAHSAFDNREECLLLQPLERAAVIFVSEFCGRGTVEPSPQLLVPLDGKVVVDAERRAVGIADLDDKAVPITRIFMGRRAMNVKVPFAPLGAAWVRGCVICSHSPLLRLDCLRYGQNYPNPRQCRVSRLPFIRTCHSSAILLQLIICQISSIAQYGASLSSSSQE